MGLSIIANPCVLAIYLKLVFTFEKKDGRFDGCQYEDDDVRFFSQTCVPRDGHYRSLKGRLTH